MTVKKSQKLNSVFTFQRYSYTRACDRSGSMVMPAWPPMTGTLTVLTSTPLASATNVLARTTSSVVTPKILIKGERGRERDTITVHTSMWQYNMFKNRPVRVVASSLFEDLSCNGNCRVDWICDDQNHSLGAVPGNQDNIKNV